MFIGREKELFSMKNALTAVGTAVMVYGKRKVGKTTLIRQFLINQQEKYVYYECIKDSLEANLDAFTKELFRGGIFPAAISFPSFQELFVYLNSLPERLIIVIDEYPYLKVMNDVLLVDSVFQNIIDNRLKNLNLILSGSHVGMMRSLLEEQNALYGRFRAVIQLAEFSYYEAQQFYPGKKPYDKIAFYSVFGGSPYVNEQLDPDASVRQNIIRTVLNTGSSVSLYADNLLISDYSNRINAERIFAALQNGQMRYGELEKALHMEKTGNLNRQLKVLTDMDIICRNNPVNRVDDTKKTTYSINDNLLRFYYSFIYKNKSALQMLGADVFFDEYIGRSLTTYISHRFEEICRDYFSCLAKSKELPGIRNIGTLYYDDPVNRKNGEFDVALAYADHYDVIEVKYLTRKLSVQEMRKEAEQIYAIPGIRIGKIGFISANGFEEVSGFSPCLTAEDLYREF